MGLSGEQGQAERVVMEPMSTALGWAGEEGFQGGGTQEKAILKRFTRRLSEKATGELSFLFTWKWGPLSNIPGHRGIFNRTIGYMFLGLWFPSEVHCHVYLDILRIFFSHL